MFGGGFYHLPKSAEPVGDHKAVAGLKVLAAAVLVD